MDDIKKKFSELYDQYVEKIYRFIFLKVNSQEIAEDLCSETFLKAWQFFKNPGKGIENPSAFLYKIAKNLVIDHYREKGKVQILSADLSPIVDPRKNVEQKTILDFEMENIRKNLAQLKEDYQNVIIWHYLDDLSIPEIANLLGRTESATRVLLSRALKVLREKIRNN